MVTKVYIILVKLFYANLKKEGPKGNEFYTNSLKGIQFTLTFATLYKIFNLKPNPAKVYYQPFSECVQVCLDSCSKIPIS